jgi:hydroxyacyl-ACP dehydratase HTD2-like protein with hotdog domain
VTVEIPVGLEEIRPLVKRPTALQLFLFSAATWNPHRIHYEGAYAAEEGYPDALVQAHLHASFVAEAVRRTIGPRGRLLRLGWQNRGIAVPGDTLTCDGRATAASETEDGVVVEYSLEERNQRGELCVSAWATALIPQDVVEPGGLR